MPLDIKMSFLGGGAICIKNYTFAAEFQTCYFKLKKKESMYKRISSLIWVLLLPLFIMAQGVTTSSLSGNVEDAEGPMIGVSIDVVHEPSGTRTKTVTNMDGKFVCTGLRVGGPYVVTVTYVGYRTQVLKGLNLNLGEEAHLDIDMEEDSRQLGEVVIQGSALNNMKKSLGSGVGMIVNKNALSSMPTISRSISDFTRMLPQAGDNGIMGKGGKSNNVTVDGATFNNTFGLGSEKSGLPGSNAGANPISLDALDQISVEASPYNVKVGGFTGAGINVVTKSGDNTFRATAYDYIRNNKMAGHKVADGELSNDSYTENTFGANISGPIIKNKLFFFANFEYNKATTPISNYILGDGSGKGNISSVPASTADQLRDFLVSNYNYNPGSYQNVDKETKSTKFLVKIDWNINDNNKFTVRYNQLNAKSLGGTMSTATAAKFSDLLYWRNNDIYNITGELNSKLSQSLNNKVFISYNSMPDYREPYSSLFPNVTITNNGSNIIFGTDKAAYQNRVSQKIFQAQDEVTYLLKNHKFTAGLNWQFTNLSNSFTYNPFGAFTFNTLEDFYNSSKAGTTTPIGVSTGLGRPSKYELNYTTQEGRMVTLSNPKISQLAFYLQDEMALSDRFNLTAGLRFDLISITNKPQDNVAVHDMTFQDADGNSVKYNTSNVPGASLLVSPRVGFNWKLNEEGTIALKGGSGLFTGLIPFVYLEKMYGINGLNEGAISATKAEDLQNYPFQNETAYYKPNGGSANSTYELNLVNSKFKMPQTWRSSLGIDIRTNDGWTFGLEGVYSKDFHSAYYVNANIDHKTTTTGANGQTYYTNNRINSTVTKAYVLEECNMGYSYFLTASVRKAFDFGLNASLAYTYGQTKSPYEFASTTPGSAFNGAPVVGNPNKPVNTYATYDLRHRLVGDLSYKATYAKQKLYTVVGLFLSASQQGRTSYIYGGSGDVNGDGSTSNDLIFIPAKQSDINLVEYTQGGKTITVEEQWTALDNFINNSSYLRSHRGQFAERNGSIAPWYCQLDLHLAEGIIPSKKHKFEITCDIKNFLNIFNKNWGVIKTASNAKLITAKTKDTFTVNPTNLSQKEYTPYMDASSAWSMQIGFRYTFN